MQEMLVKLEDQAGESPVNTKQGALHLQSKLNWERAVDTGSDGQEHSTQHAFSLTTRREVPVDPNGIHPHFLPQLSLALPSVLLS